MRRGKEEAREREVGKGGERETGTETQRKIEKTRNWREGHLLK